MWDKERKHFREKAVKCKGWQEGGDIVNEADRGAKEEKPSG